MTIGGEERVVQRDSEGSGDWVPYPSPLSFRLTLCSAPVYGDLDAHRVAEWLHFHLTLQLVEVGRDGMGWGLG